MIFRFYQYMADISPALYHATKKLVNGLPKDLPSYTTNLVNRKMVEIDWAGVKIVNTLTDDRAISKDRSGKIYDLSIDQEVNELIKYIDRSVPYRSSNPIKIEKTKYSC